MLRLWLLRILVAATDFDDGWTGCCYVVDSWFTLLPLLLLVASVDWLLRILVIVANSDGVWIGCCCMVDWTGGCCVLVWCFIAVPASLVFPAGGFLATAGHLLLSWLVFLIFFFSLFSSSLLSVASLVFRIMVSPSMLGLVENPMVLEATLCSSSPTSIPICGKGSVSSNGGLRGRHRGEAKDKKLKICELGLSRNRKEVVVDVEENCDLQTGNWVWEDPMDLDLCAGGEVYAPTLGTRTTPPFPTSTSASPNLSSSSTATAMALKSSAA
ncbi:hypothetical protein LWI29_009944 [Acer saccharum]|uniref:Transmembrane protein n=1 Tax=Acer saccharum TaxID=4024 RepID=A0AA39VSK9_ACESA|nr:hypothetical protein LWI29_009944 [Acer saccharum]